MTKKDGIDLDKILEELGSFGKYQIRTYCYILLPILFSAMYNAQYVFNAAKVEHRCVVPQCESPPYKFAAGPWAAFAYPPSGGACEMKVNTDGGCTENSFSSTTVECNHWVYADNNSIVSEFNLACKEWQRTLVGTIHSVGLFAALPLTGYVSDTFGRRTAFLLTSVLGGVAGLIRSLSPNYIMYMVFEFIEPLVCSGVYSTGFILALEMVGLKRRVLGGNVISSTFAIGQVVLGLVAWAIPYWRTFTRVIYAPSLLFIFYGLVVEESVRWLLANGNKKEAARIVFKAASVNKVKLSPESVKMLTDEHYHQPAEVTDSNKPEKVDIKLELKENEKHVQVNEEPKVEPLVPKESAPEKVQSKTAEEQEINKPKDDLNENKDVKVSEQADGKTIEKRDQEKKKGSDTETLERTSSHHISRSILIQIIKSRVIMSRLMICSFWWITVTFTYYGLSINSVSLAGNSYVNYILTSLVEIPGYALSVLTLDRFGRKYSIITAFLICGGSLISLPFVPQTEDLVWLATTCNMVGKLSISMIFSSIYIYTSELFPTNARHSLLGSCSMVGRVGSILAPQTPLLFGVLMTSIGKIAISMVFSSIYIYTIELFPTMARHSLMAFCSMVGRCGSISAPLTPLLMAYWSSLPYLLFGVMALTSGALMMLTPETLGRKLPDTIHEAEHIATQPRVLPREPTDLIVD